MNKNLLIVFAFLLFNIGYGQQLKTWTGAVSTAWDDDDNWDSSEKPTASDNVLITNATNQPIISTAGASCAKLELNNPTSGSIVVLTVKGAGSFSPGSIIMNSSGGDTSRCSLNISTGKVSVSGNITMNGNSLQNDVTFSGDGNLLIGGLMTGGTLNSDEKGTVTYNGTGTRNLGVYTYNNLTISGSGVRTITSGVIVNGKLNMAGTATVSSAPSYGIDASLQYSAGSFTVGPEWVSPFTAKGGVEITTPGLSLTSVVTIPGSITNKRFSDGVPLIIDEDASLIMGNTDMYFGGDFINNRGSLTTDGFIYLTGNVNQSIASFTSSKGVTMNKGAGTATFTGNITTKKLTINGLGTLSLGSGLTHSFTDWERTLGTLNARSSLLKISGNVIGTGGTFLPGTGTVDFNGGDQNLGQGSITYNNLTLSGSGTKTFGAVTTINETISIVDGVKADLTANLVHTAKNIKIGTSAGAGGSWGSSLSNAANKNNTFFVSNNGIINVGPTIVISTTNLTAFTTTYGTPSSSKSFDISGLAMLEGIVVTAPSGFEVSTDGTTFSNTLTIGAAGAIASKTIFVRLKGTINANDYSGNIVLTSNGTTTINVTIATSTVNKAPLTISADNKNKSYGSDNPALTMVYAGFVNGDTAANLTSQASVATTALKGSAVGDYPITVSGAVSPNYTITYASNAKLSVTPAVLTISADNKSKAYGSDNPALTLVYAGFVNGDTAANLTSQAAVTTTAVKGSAVGDYPITVSGAVSPNYTITYASNAKLSVTPAVLTISADNKSKSYGSDNPVLTVVYAGFVNGDTAANLTTQAAVTTTAVKGSAVGDYPITVSGAVSPNYTITYASNAKLSVTPSVLTISADDKNKAYGSDNPALTVVYAGFVNGDTAANLTSQASVTTTAVKGSAVGDYPITVSGAVSPNYTITYASNAKLSVTPAVLTISADNKSKAYGSDNPALTLVYAGFVNGDTAANLTSQAAVTTTAVKGSAVGDYPITVSGAVSPNYTITYVSNAKLSVTPAVLTISADDKNKAYGSDNPALTVVYAGFVNGDTASSLTSQAAVTTTAVKGSAVGDYPITVSGAVSPNYTITYASNAKLSVTPAVLTISADDKNKSYGSDNPALTLVYAGFVNGDTAANLTSQAAVTTTAVKGSAVGDYPITVSGAVSPNYTINFISGILKVVASNDSGLTDLAISEGTLSPAFAEGTKDYTATVPKDVETIKVTPVTGDDTATVTVNGITVPSGTASGDIPLKVGENTITTVVTAADGTTSTYTVIVTREPSNDSGLTDLAISEGILSPTFAEGTKDYTATVPKDVESIKVTPVTGDDTATATVTVNGVTVPSGTASGDIPLKVGENTITTVVTAADGTTSTYTVIVTRDPSNDSGLTDLAISEGVLSPTFAEGTKDYTATVPNDVTTIKVTPVTGDNTATVTVNGVTVPSGTASGDIPLKVGENTITTVVTAADGTTSTYTVIVTRDPSNDSGLTDLAISEGVLSPTFAEGTKDYTATVPNDVTTIKVTPVTGDNTATVTVNGVTVPSGTASGDIPLQVGENIITTVVTAADGTTSTYTVIVTRESSSSKTDEGLSDIDVSKGELSPAFDKDTKDYRVDVPNETNSIIITPKTIDPTATVEMKVDGKTIDPTAPIDLKVGDNVVTIVVTAEDGTQETYTVIVNRADDVPQAIVPTNIITPNGDGKNDHWIIPGIEKYPNNSVKVFDRAARLVYSGNNYNNDWDGNYKGAPLTEDTYYYLIDLGNGSPKLKGFITIVRD